MASFFRRKLQSIQLVDFLAILFVFIFCLSGILTLTEYGMTWDEGLGNYIGSVSSVIETSDGGFFVVGTSNGSVWVAKTDSSGNVPMSSPEPTPTTEPKSTPYEEPQQPEQDMTAGAILAVIRGKKVKWR